MNNEINSITKRLALVSDISENMTPVLSDKLNELAEVVSETADKLQVLLGDEPTPDTERLAAVMLDWLEQMASLQVNLTAIKVAVTLMSPKGEKGEANEHV